MEFMFVGINVFWIRLIVVSAQGLKWVLRCAQCIFAPANVNYITIIITLEGTELIKTLKKTYQETFWTITKAFLACQYPHFSPQDAPKYLTKSLFLNLISLFQPQDRASVQVLSTVVPQHPQCNRWRKRRWRNNIAKLHGNGGRGRIILD